MAADRTILKVDDIVNRYDVGIRTLQRLFAKYVGGGPKWVIQRYRLHEAAARLAGSPAVSQAGLASELGYSDQAHFVRDFERIVGTSRSAILSVASAFTPAPWAARCDARPGPLREALTAGARSA